MRILYPIPCAVMSTTVLLERNVWITVRCHRDNGLITLAEDMIDLVTVLENNDMIGTLVHTVLPRSYLSLQLRNPERS